MICSSGGGGGEWYSVCCMAYTVIHDHVIMAFDCILIAQRLSASDWISSKSFTQPSISDLKNIHHIFGTYSWNWGTVVGFNVVVFHVYMCPPSQRCTSKPQGQGQYMEDLSTHTRAGINENRRSKGFSLKTTRASDGYITWIIYQPHLTLMMLMANCIWVRSWRCGCLANWFCHQLIAKPGGRLNKKDGLTRYGNSHVKDKTS